MNFLKPFIIVGASLLSFAALGQDLITNFMSPIVSYQYPDNSGSEALTNGGIESPIISYEYLEDFGSAALTNGGILSPIVSYQYLEWPGNGILNLQYSPTVSYYYPMLDAPTLNIVSTTQIPTMAESTPAWASIPQTPSQLEVFEGGVFTNNPPFPLATTANTIVLTSGWIPTLNGNPLFPNGGPDGWPTEMAKQLVASGVTANLVTWNWTNAATSSVIDPEKAGSQAPTNGWQLGQALLKELGQQYQGKIQFIGHSFGTLVNAYAADFLQGNRFAEKEPVSPTPWPSTNMLMTLFDEAEIGANKSFNALSLQGLQNLWELGYALASGNGNYLNSAPPYYHPLPKRFAWAENYVSAFGLFHRDAVNVILTNGLPTAAPNFPSFFKEVGTFHFYPVSWYQQTIDNNKSVMGFKWPLLWLQDDPTFSNRPATNSVYVQAYKTSDWDLTLTNWSYTTNWLQTRFQGLREGFIDSPAQFAGNTIFASGAAVGLLLFVPGPGTAVATEGLITLDTHLANSLSSQVGAQPLGISQNGNVTNVPAYVWVPLIIPTNAVSLSFNYVIEGNWQNDALAAALNGTNVLFLPANEIETNAVFTSGPIDVSAFAGQTNELFIGIVGGTSTNAQLTVENLTFSIPSKPTLEAQANDGSLLLSWPLSAQNYTLQTTTNLADLNSWETLTNVPAIVNLQNTITNTTGESQRFFRLIESQ